MEEILNNPYYSTAIILFSQIVFLYLRTLNVIYTTERRMFATIITGNGIGLAWLISTSIGVSSMLSGEIIPIFAFLVGGSIGTYLGLKKEIKKHKNNEENKSS